MIKGLYFKLNMDKHTDKEIYDFFIQESKKLNVNKIDILYSAMLSYIEARYIETKYITDHGGNK